jgi:glutamine amidotransferase
MCELFGMSASQPITIRRELSEFRLRGGLVADNPDGWGLAWREKGNFQLAKEPEPAFRSTLFEDIGQKLNSSLVIGHVRKANFPPINTLNNTHPFQRTCCGKAWVFAHNGLVPDIVWMEQGNYQAVCMPAGETDSEFAFCHLLSHLARDFNDPATHAGLSFETLAAASELVASHGKFNFLMSDGEHLIAYGHDRLHYLERRTGDAASVMIATEPLNTSEGWASFAAGELRIYRSGRLVEQTSAPRTPSPEQADHERSGLPRL